MLREEIRDGIGEVVLRMPFYSVPVNDLRKMIGIEVCNYLHSKNVVIKEEGELPGSPDTNYLISQYDGEEATAEDVALMHLNGIEKGKRLMLKAGYTKTSPLIDD